MRRLTSCPSPATARQSIRHDLRFRLRALRAAVMETDADRAGFHVATADYRAPRQWPAAQFETFPAVSHNDAAPTALKIIQ